MSELDHSINRTIPTFFYEIYEKEDEIYGHLVNWKPEWEAAKDYVVVYKFLGREANYWIATDDRSLLRKDALSFAVRVHEGRCRILHIDLSQIQGKREKQ